MNEQQLRSIIKQVIQESSSRRTDMLVEYDEDGGGFGGDGGGGALYKAFVSPFVDVVQSANLFTKDVLNILGFAFKTLITFSPKKLRESREKYKTRREKIAQEWKPLMDRARGSLKNADVGLMAMIFAPNIYFGVLGSKIAGAGVNTVDGYLQAMGIKQFVSDKNATLEAKLESWIADQEREANREKEKSSRAGLAGQLRVFFFGEAAWHDGSLLSEADDDSAKGEARSESSGATGPLDYNRLAQDLFGEGGPLADLFASSQEEMLLAKKEQIDSLVGTANTIIKGLRSISGAKSLEDFQGALEVLKSQLAQRGDKEAIDLAPIEKAIQGLRGQMEKKYEEVLKGGPAPKGADKGDIETVAKRASQEAFESAAGELRKMAGDAAEQATKNYRGVIMSELTSDLPKEGSLGKALSGSSMGKELEDLVKKAVDSIGVTSAA